MGDYLDQTKFEWNKLNDGDRRALDFIYRTHVDALYNYGKKINPDPDLVKDCIQDLFVELWQQRKNISTPDCPRFYLLKALRYKIIRQHCRQLRHDALQARQEELSVPSYEHELLHLQYTSEQQSALKSAISKLSLRQKEALVLRYYEGMNCEEIAQIMDLQVQSVYNLLHQCIQLLRQDLQSTLLHVDLLLLTCLLSYLLYSC